MTTKKKPEKLQNILEKIKLCIANGKYILTIHALERQLERIITLPETLHVLKTGYEEKRKTSFDHEQNTWKYAIRGKTIRNEFDVRVIVAFEESELLIITVMYIEELS